MQFQHIKRADSLRYDEVRGASRVARSFSILSVLTRSGYEAYQFGSGSTEICVGKSVLPTSCETAGRKPDCFVVSAYKRADLALVLHQCAASALAVARGMLVSAYQAC